MPTLLIADDHPLFRAALRGAADEAADDIQTCEAGTLDDVMATLETRADIDLVLLDLHMPGNHGLAGLAALRAHGPCVIHRRSFAPVRQALEPAAPVCGDLFAPVGLVPA